MKQIRKYTRDSEENPRIMEESYTSPILFWNDLYNALNSSACYNLNSIPFQSYSFYEDIIIRNKNNKMSAFCWYDSNGQNDNMSYRALGERVSEKAAGWNRAGVEPGLKICVISPFGPEYIIAMLTALKTGAIITVLEPMSPIVIERQLDELAPDFIDCGNYTGILPKRFQAKIITMDETVVIEESGEDYSHNYQTGDTAFIAFDYASSTPFVPIEISADTAFLAPLRDGAITLQISRGDNLIVSDDFIKPMYPGLVLASLLNGATCTFLPKNVIREKVDILTKAKNATVIVSEEVRDILLNSPSKVKWKSWFITLGADPLLEQWQNLYNELKLKNVPGGALRFSSASLGCSFYAPLRKSDVLTSEVFPSAGVPWFLADILDKKTPSKLDIGLFAFSDISEADGEPYITENLLRSEQRGCLYNGVNVVGKMGVRMLGEEVCSLIEQFEFCRTCVLLETMLSTGSNAYEFSLLVFHLQNNGLDRDRIRQSIRYLIETTIGKPYVPDKIKFFRYLPRLSRGDVDRQWVYSQYYSGGLDYKSRDSVHYLFSQCRALYRTRKNGNHKS
ncbi:MAG: AMP-binding protein [candidate division Zixibacteria bacterium]|nr:AMP-binding protein [candidate division Zixibacteria bacterium]